MREPLCSRGQSESVGVILLTAVMVILVGGFGVVFLGADNEGTDGPLIDAEVNATSDQIAISHAGGESVPVNELDVRLRTDGDSERYTFDAANVTNDDGDDGSDRADASAAPTASGAENSRCG